MSKELRPTTEETNCNYVNNVTETEEQNVAQN